MEVIRDFLAVRVSCEPNESWCWRFDLHMDSRILEWSRMRAASQEKPCLGTYRADLFEVLAAMTLDDIGLLRLGQERLEQTSFFPNDNHQPMLVCKRRDTEGRPLMEMSLLSLHALHGRL